MSRNFIFICLKTSSRKRSQVYAERLTIKQTQSNTEHRRQSADVANLPNIGLMKNHSEKAGLSQFAAASKLHSQVLRKNLDTVMATEKNRYLSDNNDCNPTSISSNESVRSFIFVKKNLRRAPNVII